MPGVAEKTVTLNGITFTYLNDTINVHVPTGRQEFSISPQEWVSVLTQMGLRPQDYLGS